MVGFPYLYYNICYLLCNNTRNPPVRIKLSLWEISPLPEFPRSSLNVATGSLQSAELELFINLLYSLKSSLRINTKIRLSDFSWVRLEKERKQKRIPRGKAAERGPDTICLWESLLGQCWPILTPTSLSLVLTFVHPEPVGSHLYI